jgi:hypothetical protein
MESEWENVHLARWQGAELEQPLDGSWFTFITARRGTQYSVSACYLLGTVISALIAFSHHRNPANLQGWYEWSFIQ